MKTPICDFLRDYAVQNPVRLHMPGHKGTVHAEDITEVPGADVLYASSGIIRESEENAASLFGAARTVYSAEGSSLSIRAMLYLLALYARERGETPRILAARNAHRVFVTTAALLDIDVDWIFPQDGNYLACPVSAEALDARLCESRPTAVYLTSPDYLGNLADIAALSAVCRRHGVLLAVDNAHGAYLRFLPESLHPMQNGADICCDSAHKTLPVLTGGAYLHIAEGAPAFFASEAEKAMGIFASTSPSYLILQSLDRANALLSDGFREALAQSVSALCALKHTLADRGFVLVGEEPLKLTLAPKSFGYTGEGAYKFLQEKNICCEFADPDFLVMMFSPSGGKEDMAQLEDALRSLQRKPPILEKSPALKRPTLALRPHDALLAPSQDLPVSQCVGKVLAAATVSCPPAVPVIACGERVGEDAPAVLQYYCIDTLNVIREPLIP